MLGMLPLTASLLLGAWPGLAAAAQITPTQQVISMMTEMRAKGDKNMDEEQKVYFRYSEWADDEATKLGFEIKDGAAKIEELVAFITKADSTVKELGQQIAALEAEINTLEGEKADAIAIRQEQNTEYLKLSQDYSESVDALTRAIQVLKSQNYDRAQAEMLLQRMAPVVPGMPRVLAAFLQQQGGSSSNRRDDGAPEVAAYEFQSGGIVAMLEGLFEKFRHELADVEDAETNQAHEFSLVKLHLSNTIAKDKSDRDEKVVLKSKKAAASASAKGELAETRAEKAADENLKAETEATFAAKTATYKENQKVRKAELEAIDKAIEIISSPAVAESYAKHVNLAQVAGEGKAVSLLQLGRSRRRAAVAQQASALLAARARALGSRVLADAAAKVAADPFAKVIGMIEDLIEKLKAQASVEAEHKEWCDEQLKANKLKRNKKTAQVNQLIADIEGLEASIAEKGARIDLLVKEQAQLAKAMSEATELREAEKATNLATIADAKAGFEAVGKALVVLKEFYQSQASLLQQVPEMAEYKGMQRGNTGVVGMLEVIQTDFARLRSETEAAEAAAAQEYDAFTTKSEAAKLAKHNEEVQLRLDKDQEEYERGETKKDLSATEEELARAKKYFGYLKPNCLEVHVSWGERVAHRKEEIAALKEAYAILDQKSSE